MSKQLRQIILYIVIIASIIGMAAVLLYSAGYRFNWSTWRLEETGALRIVAPGIDKIELWIYPTASYSASSATNFTHLDPGEYTLVAKAEGYQDSTLKLQVRPRQTTVVEPLVLWNMDAPIPTAQPLITDTAQDSIKRLSISLQQAVSTIPTDDIAELVYIDSDRAILVQHNRGQVTLLRSTNNEVSTKLIAEQITHVEFDNEQQLLLQGTYQLGTYNLATDDFTTLLRISDPITAAHWYVGTPYVIYSQAGQLISLDTRELTQYVSQVITTLPNTITQFTIERDGVIEIESGESTYSYSARVK